MGLAAYKQAQTRTETPRELEYRLFAQVTRGLMELQSAPRSENLAKWADILDWNRRVWSYFAMDCSSSGNQLPENLRASIISLSLWVSRYSSDVLRGNGDLEDLITINRNVMQGLAPQADAAAA